MIKVPIHYSLIAQNVPVPHKPNLTPLLFIMPLQFLNPLAINHPSPTHLMVNQINYMTPIDTPPLNLSNRGPLQDHHLTMQIVGISSQDDN